MKHASRKYVDLIHDASSKWANWDPPNKVQVGDYGTINKETGLFENEGNVYDRRSYFNLDADQHPETNAEEEIFEAISRTARKSELGAGVDVDVAGLAEAAIKGQWHFERKRGALLIMVKSRGSSMPHATRQRLITHPTLKTKSLVTDVISCPAYSMYLSNGKNDAVSLALLGRIPIPGAPGISLGSHLSASWWSLSASGLFRSACDPKGDYSFTPLFVLKQIFKPPILYRDSPPLNPITEDTWQNAVKPWDPLDEDGEEEIIEDTVFD